MAAGKAAADGARRWGLYVHLPFCRQKCFYCDFPSYAGQEGRMAVYVEALLGELAREGAPLRAAWGPPRTVYLGGGTPTALPPALMERLLAGLREFLAAAPDALEFTCECNPGTVDAAYLSLLRAGGVNRLSLGVQTFDDALLRRIGRIHTAAQARAAVRQARAAGFRNLSLDLMYGLPGQTLAGLEMSVQQALALAPQHISIYGLQVEEGTAFARAQAAGRLALPSDEESEAMYDYMTTALPVAGYARYEISNFARPGFESRHNLGYWQDVPYLGVGAAAHSYLDGQRYENPRGIEEYLAALRESGRARREEEPLTRATSMEEFAFLALRTARGIDRARFAARFGCELASVYADAIARMRARGFLEEDAQGVRLTPLGMKYGNWVFEAFLLDE
ncbi:radical SAM family heme chaperone HemW [uncultured Selenomonas sp.]|uniref:radical SAM family heme chaperone HemW n=1 Tax=uncultured Selenomonas sp. TaxID=159275 RepID=UPI0028062957|nr:radical SAM family heme chaperone HemW [uncultured Selenomonas sp.]